MRARRSLRRVLAGSLSQGRWRWLLRAGHRGLRLRLGLPARAPLFATLSVTWHCNYRCFMCDFPLRDATPADQGTLIQRVHALADEGALALGITGGEPLVHRGIFEIIAAARQRGLLVHLNTNGSELTERHLPRLHEAGLHSMNLSLDGAKASTHDRLRGAPGSFEQIRRTVDLWRQGRRPGSPRLGLVMAISRDNFREIEGFVTLAEEWGVDAAGFLPHHHFHDQDPSFSAEECRELASALSRVEGRADNSPAYLRGLVPFLGGEPTPVRCTAPDSHRALDADGTAYPCVPLMTLGRSGIRWEDRTAHRRPRPDRADREEVCRRCWWNCHRELDLALGVLRAPRSSGSWHSAESSPTSSS